MKCIIKIDNSGNFVGHPMTLTNFIQAFPDLDISGDDAPDGYAWFTRTKNPMTEDIRKKIVATYEKTEDGKNYQDVYTLQDKTADEIQAYINELNQKKPFPSWTVNEQDLTIEPPTPRPAYDKNNPQRYSWDETTLSWIGTPINKNTP